MSLRVPSVGVDASVFVAASASVISERGAHLSGVTSACGAGSACGVDEASGRSSVKHSLSGSMAVSIQSSSIFKPGLSDLEVRNILALHRPGSWIMSGDMGSNLYKIAVKVACTLWWYHLDLGENTLVELEDILGEVHQHFDLAPLGITKERIKALDGASEDDPTVEVSGAGSMPFTSCSGKGLRCYLQASYSEGGRNVLEDRVVFTSLKALFFELYCEQEVSRRFFGPALESPVSSLATVPASCLLSECSREQAEQLIAKSPADVFIIRESSKGPLHLALSYKTRASVAPVAAPIVLGVAPSAVAIGHSLIEYRAMQYHVDTVARSRFGQLLKYLGETRTWSPIQTDAYCDFSLLRGLQADLAQAERMRAIEQFLTGRVSRLLLDPRDMQTCAAVLEMKNLPSNAWIEWKEVEKVSLEALATYLGSGSLRLDLVHPLINQLIQELSLDLTAATRKRETKFLPYLDSGKHSDCVLVSKSAKEFRAHRIVICSESSHFEALFSSSFRESETRQVHLAESNESIELLLKALYGQVTINRDNAGDYLHLANFYDVPFLKAVVLQFWKDDYKNWDLRSETEDEPALRAFLLSVVCTLRELRITPISA